MFGPILLGAPATTQQVSKPSSRPRRLTAQGIATTKAQSGTTTYVVSGVTGTVKTGSKIEIALLQNATRESLRSAALLPSEAIFRPVTSKDKPFATTASNGKRPQQSLTSMVPKVGVGTGFSITAAPTEVLQVSARGNEALSARLLISDPDPYAVATPNNPELQFQYATTTASGTEKNWHWSLFVDKAPGASLNSFNIWGAGYDSTTAGGGSTRLTILPNGYVGIGIATPELPLQIDHATAPFLGFRTAGAGTPQTPYASPWVRGESTAANRAEIEVQSKHDLAFFTSSTLRAVISSDGSFVIGTSTQFADPAAFLVHKAAVPGTGFITGEGPQVSTLVAKSLCHLSIQVSCPCLRLEASRVEVETRNPGIYPAGASRWRRKRRPCSNTARRLHCTRGYSRPTVVRRPR